MGGQSCKLKAILNGGMVQSATEQLCYMIEEIPYDNFPEDAGLKAVALLNQAEDAVFKAQRIMLESQGFKGPWPHSLTP